MYVVFLSPYDADFCHIRSYALVLRKYQGLMISASALFAIHQLLGIVYQSSVGEDQLGRVSVQLLVCINIVSFLVNLA